MKNNNECCVKSLYKVVMNFLIVGSVLFSSLVQGSENTDLYKALAEIKNKNYEQANVILDEFLRKDSMREPIDTFKANSILALSKIQTGGLNFEVMEQFENSLCVALDNDAIERVGVYCAGQSTPLELAGYEQELLAAVLLAYGTMSWRDQVYVDGINAYALAAEFASLAQKNSKSEGGSLQTGNKVITAEADIAMAKEDLKANLIQQALSGQLGNNGSPKLDPELMQQLVMAEQSRAMQNVGCQLGASMPNVQALQVLANKNPELKNQLLNNAAENCEPKNIKSQQHVGKAVANEKEIIRGLAIASMCPASNDINISSIEEGVEFTQQHLAESFELLRGRRSGDLSIIQTDVMDALDNYIDKLNKVKSQYGNDLLSKVASRLNKDGRGFIEKVAQCQTALGVESKFRNAILTSLSRRDRTGEYTERATEVLGKLRTLSSQSGSMDVIPMLTERRALASSELGLGKPQKAKQLLADLFSGLDRIKQVSAPQHQNIAMMTVLSALDLYAEAESQLEGSSSFSRMQEQFVNAFGIVPGGAANAFYMRPGDVKNLMAQSNKAMMKKATGQAVNQLKGMENLMEGLNPEMGGEFKKRLSALSSLQDSESMETMLASLGENMPLGEREKFQSAFAGGGGMFNMDIMGSSLDLWRDKINQARLAELVLASANLQINNVSEAKKWLGAKDLSKLSDYAFRPEVIALEYQVKARLAQTASKIDEASSMYKKAIQAWYFSPQSIEVLGFMGKSPTWLIEEALQFEIDHKRYEQAFDYSELARTVKLDNPELYGYLEPVYLEAFQIYLKRQYKNMVSAAKRNAIDLGQKEFFEEQWEKAQSAQKNSMRAPLSPLLPFVTGLAEINEWLDVDELHKWMWYTERFNNLYFRANINDYRGSLANGKSNKSISEKELLSRIHQQVSGEDLNTGFASNTYAPLKTIRNKLDAQTTLVTYIQFSNQTHSFSVTQSDLVYQGHDTGSVSELALAFQNAPSDQLGTTLYKKILEPFEKYLKENLVFVANGPLQNIAYVALSNDRGYLIDQYRIRYAPSSARFVKNIAGSGPKKMLVVEAGAVPGQRPLPMVDKEIEYIKASYDTTVLGGEQVKRQKILSEISRHGLLHFAGHSVLNKDFPDLSTLYLYGESLAVGDIGRLNLNKLSLAVLSSCSSAENSTMVLNNEFSSLNAAFLNGGAASVLASLHIVEDKTASELIIKFYEGLTKGLRKDEALRQAQQYIKAQISSNPKDWAGFILSGDPSPLS